MRFHRSYLLPLLAALALPGLAQAQHLDNPFSGSIKMYVNPDYTAKAAAEAAKQSDATLKANMIQVGNQPTAVWFDRMSAVPNLATHLDQTLAQGANLFLGVVYDLPGRDCHALASNGELPLTEAGLTAYKTQYIDPMVAIAASSKYAGIRMVFVVEPDSLPNLVTNMSDPDCAAAAATQTFAPDGIYREAIRYAVNKLHALPNVYLYIDAGHSGWLGWDTNMTGWITEMNKVAGGFTAGKSAIEGFVDDTANTLPLKEPFISSGTVIGGSTMPQSKFYDWNPFVDEQGYSAAMYSKFVAAGWPATMGILHDSSRNGWGGPDRPTAASTATEVNAWVTASKIDRRAHRGLWCNPLGAGVGERPIGAPSGWADQHFDAFVWVKPPGESDGASSDIPNDQGKKFDRMCDPTYTTEYGVLTGATPNAPLAGDWFSDQFVTLVKNAYPPFGSGPVCVGVPNGPTNLVAAQVSGSQMNLTWTGVSPPANCSITYSVHVGTATGFTPSAATLKASGLTTTSYQVQGLTPNTTYFFLVQAVDALGAAGSNYFQMNTPNGYTLTVAKTGTGASGGTVTGGGINCGTACSVVTNPSVTVTLTATVASGTTFTGWTGDCTGTATTCSVLMSQSRSVSAAFTSGGGNTLTVTKAGTGSGTVTSTPSGISCGATCSASFSSGTAVTLSAVASSGSTFTGFSGPCVGTGTCIVTMTQAQSVTATFTGSGTTPVARYGRLKVCGTHICDASGNQVQLKGMSWFWSNTGWGAERFFNATAVQNLYTTWGATVIRAPLGVEGGGSYVTSNDTLNPVDKAGNLARVTALIDAAISTGVYVLVDWHYSSPTVYQTDAQAFFQQLAQKYASSPNIIWEPYNEPTTNSWSSLKSYHEAIIQTIRAAGSQNLVVCGTPTWSQDVDVASQNKVVDSASNVAYTLHFYAGTHTQWLRDKANTAMSNGAAIFVTEWGTVDASGNGNYNPTESTNWTTWMDQNKISSANWSLNDKAESASALVAGASATGPWADSALTQSGLYVKAYISASQPPPTFTLTVAKAGTGTGTVTSSSGGISCGSTCSASYASGTVVTLTAAATSPSTFGGWSVSGCGTSTTCAVTMSAAQSVTATFNGVSTSTLTVAKAGTGTGTVTSSSGGISCGSTCSATYTTGTVVTLTAAATSPSTFGGWSVSSCGTSTTCAVTMSAAQTVTATFNGQNTFALSVTKAGTGAGTVTSSSGGINCGSTCSASYASGTVVTLTAAATSPSTFGGWSGGVCSGTATTCAVTMSAARAVTATFNGTSNQTLTVAKGGTGAGTVTSSVGGINCGSACSASVATGTVVTLTAAATSPSTFGGWSVTSCGTNLTCAVTVSASQTVTATFNGGNPGTCTAANAITFTGNTNNFNSSGPVCYRTSATVNGWGCYNFDGRTVSVNGGAAASTCGGGPLPLAKSADGFTYFAITGGTYSWAGLYAW
jgi:cellulose 1,4-beta-cellobiosidase